MPDLRVRVDEWVLPSHTQAARVAEGSLDVAIAWIEEADIERLNLTAHLLWYERLDAVMPRAHQATRHESVPAAELTVLVDVCSFKSGMTRRIFPSKLSSRCGLDRIATFVDSPDAPSPHSM